MIYKQVLNMIYKQNEINIMAQGGKILVDILNKLKSATKPGMQTLDLDQIAQKLIKKDATFAFKNYRGYPANICVSINEEIVHGVPSSKKIKQEDIITIDLGIKYKDYCTDAAISFIVGKPTPIQQRLLDITSLALKKAIAKIKPNVPLVEISREIEKTIKEGGLNIVKDLTGHGVGKNLQEEPSVYNWEVDEKIILKEGMVLALEPMATTGIGDISVLSDNWTIVTSDGALSAQFEKTIAITKDGYLDLTPW